jgi:hypothetical protein
LREPIGGRRWAHRVGGQPSPSREKRTRGRATKRAINRSKYKHAPVAQLDRAAAF